MPRSLRAFTAFVGALVVALFAFAFGPRGAAAAPATRPAAVAEGSKTIVIFGGLGDLSTRMLLPSVLELSKKGLLPEDYRVVLVDRMPPEKASSSALAEMRERVTARGHDTTTAEWAAFEKHVTYVDGDVTKPDVYEHLRSKLPQRGGTQMFYLALGPNLMKPTVEGLSGAHLLDAGASRPDVRVVVEKPLGEDFASAEALDRYLGTKVGEERLYRMDHYMGKDTVHAFMRLRQQPAYRALWRSGLVERIDVRALEAVNVGARGGYYDRAGATRDMVQGHLLELAALASMDMPEEEGGPAFHASKLRALQTLRRDGSVPESVVRGQYEDVAGETGYRAEVKNAKSSTETYVRIDPTHTSIEVAGSRAGLGLETGKNLGEKRTDLVVHFKALPDELADSLKLRRGAPAEMVVSVDPKPRITMNVAGESRVVDDLDDHSHPRFAQAYAHQLDAVFRGNRTWFATSAENEARWRFADPIIGHFERSGARGLVLYPSGGGGLTRLRAVPTVPPPAAARLWIDNANAHAVHTGAGAGAPTTPGGAGAKSRPPSTTLAGTPRWIIGRSPLATAPALSGRPGRSASATTLSSAPPLARWSMRAPRPPLVPSPSARPTPRPFQAMTVVAPPPPH